ncbi:hypothetical protein SASPL_134146 [Salvia splendens]|uniref:Uncharacterized protein n=1 Tax=Salvia splendens TaxID=180675 RepID=A0A8X8ZIS2_SALSN|nr:hypothetical protein SASPL_134146 [Salvia splendens]
MWLLDEICRSVSDVGGLDVILRCLDDSVRQIFPLVLFSKVVLGISFMYSISGSDVNKNVIVEKGGADKLVNLSARFSDHPLVLQELLIVPRVATMPGIRQAPNASEQVMSIITTLCLRSPENAARAIESGAGDLDEKVSSAAEELLFYDQGSKCRKQQLIRKAKQTLKNCKAAATDALRDLGLDNYNS